MRLFFSIIIIIFYSCNSPDYEIIGRWKFYKSIKKGKEVRLSPVIAEGRRDIKFFSDGRLIYLQDDKLCGIGTTNYKILGDTLYRNIVMVEPEEKVTIYKSNYFAIKNDTLKVWEDSTWIYLYRID